MFSKVHVGWSFEKMVHIVWDPQVLGIHFGRTHCDCVAALWARWLWGLWNNHTESFWKIYHSVHLRNKNKNAVSGKNYLVGSWLWTLQSCLHSTTPHIASVTLDNTASYFISVFVTVFLECKFLKKKTPALRIRSLFMHWRLFLSDKTKTNSRHSMNNFLLKKNSFSYLSNGTVNK